MPELIVALQKSCFVRKVPFDRPPKAGIKKFGVRGCIEVSVEIPGVSFSTRTLNCGVGSHSTNGRRRFELLSSTRLYSSIWSRIAAETGNTTPGD